MFFCLCTQHLFLPWLAAFAETKWADELHANFTQATHVSGIHSRFDVNGPIAVETDESIDLVVAGPNNFTTELVKIRYSVIRAGNDGIAVRASHNGSARKANSP